MVGADQMSDVPANIQHEPIDGQSAVLHGSIAVYFGRESVLATLLFAAWCFVGMIAIGLCRIKPPQDTPEGQEHPDVAFLAWAVMLLCWPVTVLKRRNFARFGEPDDEGNPSWLVQR